MEVTGNLIASICSGKVGRSFSGTGLCIDTRKIQKNDIFVAFNGENVNGHEYISKALELGAVGAIITDKDFFSADLPLVLVQNAAEAIEKIALYKRGKSKAKFIAVTGSFGKTSTKELLRLAFAAHGKCFASDGNYNNKLGLSLTLASMEGDEEFVVLEMGMDRQGEIKPLSEMVKPDLAVITNVNPVHIANFNNIMEIALEKASIKEGMSKGSYCIINQNSMELETIKTCLERDKIKYLVAGQDSKTIEVSEKNDGILVKMQLMDQFVEFELATHQAHQAENAALSLLAVFALGLDINKSATALKKFSAMDGRGKITKFAGFNLIDDSYNANPVSMKAALENLSKAQGKKLAIIGDMRELGELSASAHRGLYDHEVFDSIDGVVLCGSQMRFLWELLPSGKKMAIYDNYQQLKNDINDIIKGYNIILVKSSFGTGLINIVKEIQKNYV